MYVRPGSDTQAVVTARMDQIDLMTKAIGCDTDAARADLTHMSARHWRRAREGQPIGVTFIANTITALRQYERTLSRKRLKPTFDNLFEIVERAREDGRAA